MPSSARRWPFVAVAAEEAAVEQRGPRGVDHRDERITVEKIIPQPAVAGKLGLERAAGGGKIDRVREDRDVGVALAIDCDGRCRVVGAAAEIAQVEQLLTGGVELAHEPRSEEHTS